MKTISCQQGSSEWHRLRAGVVTASEADSLFTPLFKPREGEGVKTFLYRKASERILGYTEDEIKGGSFAVEQGQVLEKIALPWFEFRYGVEVERVGFCLSDDGKTGCSPDGLIGTNRGLEIKCPQPPTHTKYLLEGVVPPEYRAQVHFSMFVTGRADWTFVSYSQWLPPLVIRVVRDEAIQSVIRETVAKLTAQLDDAEARIRGMMPKQQGRD